MHHIYPSSRRPDLKSKRFNIIEIDMGKHRVYHQLFGNKTPPEILEYLVTYFWKDNWMAMREVKDKANQLYYSHKKRIDPNQIKLDFQKGG